MKIPVYLIAILLIASCKKNNSEPPSSPGFLEGFLTSNPRVVISKSIETIIPPNEKNFGIYRGYYIVPSANIKLNAIGGRMPEKGTYEIMVLSGASYDFINKKYIYRDSINISDENVFQFKKVSKEVILSASERYLVVYLNKNRTSLFEAKYNNYQPNTINYFTFPMMVENIKVESLFHYYATFQNGEYYLSNGGTLTGGVNAIQGLVDFKYELFK